MNTSHTFELIDCNDGTGDTLLQFSDEFVAEQDWRPDDVIHMEVKDNSLILTNKSKEKRNKGV